MQAEDAEQATERQRFAPVAWEHVERQPGRILARVDRLTLAAHEAGHAVIGFYVGNRVPARCEVWIHSRGNGEATLEGGTAWARAVASLAGDAAVSAPLPDTMLLPARLTDEELAARAEFIIRDYQR